jgi:hypothetical protein
VSEIPEGAQRSEDGNYWWDTAKSAWQPVARDAPAGRAAEGEQRSGAQDGEPHVTDASQLRPEHVVFAMTITAEDTQVLDVPPVQEEGGAEA